MIEKGLTRTHLACCKWSSFLVQLTGRWREKKLCCKKKKGGGGAGRTKNIKKCYTFLSLFRWN